MKEETNEGSDQVCRIPLHAKAQYFTLKPFAASRNVAALREIKIDHYPD
jgi:hypothetical protein